MGDPVISEGTPAITKIPPGDGWTPLVTIEPDDGRSAFEGQFAVTLPSAISSRPTLCEVQIVRVRPGVPENPTAQDDRAFTFELDDGGKIRIRRRQNWLYTVEAMRTYSDEPLRFEARHPGPVAISLEWIVKALLLRPETARR